MTIYTRLCVFLLTMIAVQSTCAASLPLFGSIEVAEFYTKIGQSQQVRLMGSLGNTYMAARRWENKTTYTLAIGAETYDNHHLRATTAFRFIPIRQTDVVGNVWQFNSANMNNLSYLYQVKSKLYLLEQIFSYTRFAVAPGFLVGIGGAANSLSNYSETPLNTTAAPSLHRFIDSQSTLFTYELGAVLEASLKQNTVVLAYRFIDAGEAHLGLSPLQNTGDRLSAGSLYYHLISLGIRVYVGSS